MPNQTIAAVPVDLADPTVLKRFLIHLIEQLDIVLGYRGTTEYVSTAQLATAELTLVRLADTLALTDTEVEELTASLTALVETVTTNSTGIEAINETLTSTVLGSTYHDFDDAVYADLSGRAEFNTLGSNLTNAPYAPVGGETYYNYFNAIVTDNDGVVQELLAYSTTTLAPTKFFRIGDTWTEAQTLGWT